MADEMHCLKCGTELPGNAPAGICPRCLLQAGLDESVPGVAALADAADGIADVDASAGGDAGSIRHAATILTGSVSQDVGPESWPTVRDGAMERGVPETGTSVRYFGEYELLTEIARGGMGVVYRARQVRLNRTVALKMILAGQFAGPADVRRFHTEAEAAAQLDHPGIVPVYEVGEHDGHHFFTMGFVEGGSLAARLLEGPLPPRDAAQLLKQIAQAVQYAHERGVIHRDLKPANILLDRDGLPRITDFGLAKNVKQDSGLTASGQVLGTPGYMPPEQASGDVAQVKEAADIYSLGAVLYALLTGRPPFQADNALDTLMQVIEKEPVSPSALNARIPRDLETICLKCLEKDRRRRYQSADELGKELQRFLNGEPILARPIGGAARLWRWCRRNPVVAGLTAGMVVLLLSGTSVSMYFGIEARAQARGALAQKKRADDNAQKATDRANDALAEKSRADGKTKEARRHLYVAHMNLAASAWERTRAGRVRELLEEHLPQPGEEDLRGFEWHYWDRLSHAWLLDLKGHTGYVNGVAFSPDGKWLASASSDGTIKVWNAATGQEARTLKGHAGGIASVAFSRDGKRLVSGSYDYTAKVWDMATGLELVSLKGHTAQVLCVAFNPDGTRLATSSTDGTVKVWDAAAGRESFTLKNVRPENTDQILSVAFSPDGTRLVAPSKNENTFKVWDAATGDELLTMKGHTSRVMCVKYSPDGKLLASGSYDQSIKVWDAATGQELRTLKGHTDGIYSVTFSPDGKRLASGCYDQTVKFWGQGWNGWVTGNELFTLKGHTHYVLGVAFSPDGERLASASWDGTIKVWEASQNPETLSLHGQGTAISPDGLRLATPYGALVKVWNTLTDRELLSLNGHTGQVFKAAFSPDGTRLASAGSDQTVRVWDSQTGQELLALKGHAREVLEVAFSPDGKRLASGCWDGTVKVWDAATGKESLTLTGHSGSVSCLAFHPKGRRLASGGQESTIRLWDLANGRELQLLRGHYNGVSGVAFTHDGGRLASASWDQTIKIWDADTGLELRTLKGHSGSVSSVVFSPDGRRLASASYDRTVKVWDTATGQETLTRGGHAGEVMILSVAFSPDGHRLFAASDFGKIQTWDARPRSIGLKVEQEALRRLNRLDAEAIGLETLFQKVADDPTISNAVRARMRELAESYWPVEERLAFLTAERKQRNLLRDPSFEDPADASDWTPTSWRQNATAAAIEDGVSKEGKRCVRLSAETADDVNFVQEVAVQQNTSYLLCGWVRTKGVKLGQEGGIGANLSLVGESEHSRSVIGDTDWTYLAVKFDSGVRSKVRISARLGHHNSTCTGQAWFDDLCLIPLDEPRAVEAR